MCLWDPRERAMAKRTAPARRAARPRSAAAPPGPVAFTNLGKIWFPNAGITKWDVLAFYRAIAPRLVPHLRDRPVTLERIPDGLRPNAPRFWQKNTPDYYPQWIPRIELRDVTGKPVKYALVNDADTLLYLVNQGAISFHVWPSRVQHLDRPDYVLFDLDPGGAKFADVVKIARQLYDLLAELDLSAFVKTSGKSGLHVLVRWEQQGSYDAARGWAMQVAGQLVRRLPDLATTERRKSERHGHVYIDVIQNARGHHAVPPYVVRAVPEATVSTPLDWDELTPRLNPRKFTMDLVLKRIKKQKADPLAELLSA